MEKHYKAMGTIRGTRYAVQLVKRVKGMPGFAPEYRDMEVCEVVFKFPHGDGETYVQFHKDPPILTREDVEEVLTVFDEPFEESKFRFEDDSLTNNDT